MINALVTKRVRVSDVYSRPPPMNQFLALVLVSCIKLRLTAQPKLVCVKELQPTLHIVENGIVDVLNRLI